MGPEQQERVDVRDVQTFVEQVDGEEHVDLTPPQGFEGVAAVLGGGRPGHGERGDPRLGEALCHESGVADGDAESEPSHPAYVEHLVAKLPEHDAHARVVGRVDALQRRGVVVATAPLQRRQVGRVGDSEVVEGAEQVGGQGIPQPQLCSGAPAEELADVDAVRALGRSRQPDQLLGLKVVEQAPVGRRLGVVELVDDDDVEMVPR